MSNENKFLTIPGQEALLTTAKNGRQAEGISYSPVEEEEDEESEDSSRLIPRSSPVPRKRGMSIFDETAEYMKIRLDLPSRRVSFADSTGGNLVDVKEFVAFESDEEDDTEREAARYRPPNIEPTYEVYPDFQMPTSTALFHAVHANKVEVESVTPEPDQPLALNGLVRVLNISFQKAVYVRFTMDGWSTYFDYPAEYVHGSNDLETDQFAFKLSFSRPYLYHGARIEFVVRFETPEGDFWANNAGMNYGVVLTLTHKSDFTETDRMSDRNVKSILKASHRMKTDYEETLGGNAEEESVGSAETDTQVLKPSSIPEIIHPEVDIENVDAIPRPFSLSKRELQKAGEIPPCVDVSLKEQLLSISATRKSKELATSLINQPQITQPLLENAPAPDLDKVNRSLAQNNTNIASVVSVPSCHYVEESETSNTVITQSVHSPQSAECGPPTLIIDKVPFEKYTCKEVVQPLLLDIVERDKVGEVQKTGSSNEETDQNYFSSSRPSEKPVSLTEDGIILKQEEESNSQNFPEEKSIRIQELQPRSPSTREKPETAHVDDSVRFKQEEQGTDQDREILEEAHLVSVNEMQLCRQNVRPFFSSHEETRRLTTSNDSIAAGEEVFGIETVGIRNENIRHGREVLPDMVTSCMLHPPIALHEGPTGEDHIFQSTANFPKVPPSSSVLPALHHQCLAELDELTAVFQAGDHGTKTAPAGTMDFTSGKELEEGSLALPVVPGKITASPDATSIFSALASAMASVEEKIKYDSDTPDNRSQNTESLEGEAVPLKQKWVSDSMLYGTQSEAMLHHAFVVSLIILCFAIFPFVAINNPIIILILGMYQILLQL